MLWSNGETSTTYVALGRRDLLLLSDGPFYRGSEYGISGWRRHSPECQPEKDEKTGSAVLNDGQSVPEIGYRSYRYTRVLRHGVKVDGESGPCSVVRGTHVTGSRCAPVSWKKSSCHLDS